MTLRIFEANLENVRPEWRDEYDRNGDGEYVLRCADWDSLGDVEDVRGLKSSLAKTRQENKELRAKLSEALARVVVT